MSRILWLAWRYVSYYKLKSLILVTCLTITIMLPLTAQRLIRFYERRMTMRSEATPLLIGTAGNRFDLVLKSLYFTDARVPPLHMSDVDAVINSDLALPIPLNLDYTARGYPVVGTTLDYFDFRQLNVDRGTLPLRLGQAVLGATVAAELTLAPGDTILSDQRSLYDITQTYPLKMHIAGVLAPTDTPDDRAVFVDVKTAWIIAGISHGHQDVAEADDANVILQRTENEVVTNLSIVEYNEVTDENIDSFHTHAPRDELPITSIIVLPYDAKSATILKARYREPGRATRTLEPLAVVRELMQRVFEVQRIFEVGFAFVATATLLFVVLVVLLSQRVRAREMETMFRLGSRRSTTFWLQAAELGIVLAVSITLAGALAAAAVGVAPQWLLHV